MQIVNNEFDFSFDQTFDDTLGQHFIAQSADSHFLGYISTVNWLYHSLLHSHYVGCSTCLNKPSPAHALSLLLLAMVAVENLT